RTILQLTSLRHKTVRMPSIILASVSPRRRDILAQMGLSARLYPQDVDETIDQNSDPVVAARALAVRKLESARSRLDRDVHWVLGADTIVHVNGRMLGKPEDRKQAGEFIRELSGKVHRVTTGLALLASPDAAIVTAHDEAEVRFAPVSDKEVEWYLSSEEWRGVAGAYRIQGKAACFIDSLSGSYSTVMGLPIRTLYSMLLANGYPFLSEVQPEFPL
ncbi:MAG: Maf family protein, partial [Spirochaetia bacterium]